jgi:hypothetical protein
MSSAASTRHKLITAQAEGRLVTCKIPGGGDLSIAFERHQLEQALEAWRAMDDAERGPMIRSVRNAIARTLKRIKRNKASQKEFDAFASDMQLWLGWEMLYADGEKHIIEGPTEEDLSKPSPQELH